MFVQFLFNVEQNAVRAGHVGTGSYTMAYRKQLLEDLLTLQNEVEMELISPEEIAFIHQTWDEEIVNLARMDSEDTS